MWKSIKRMVPFVWTIELNAVENTRHYIGLYWNDTAAKQVVLYTFKWVYPYILLVTYEYFGGSLAVRNIIYFFKAR